jgi:hypothetical protein
VLETSLILGGKTRRPYGKAQVMNVTVSPVLAWVLTLAVVAIAVVTVLSYVGN